MANNDGIEWHELMMGAFLLTVGFMLGSLCGGSWRDSVWKYEAMKHGAAAVSRDTGKFKWNDEIEVEN